MQGFTPALYCDVKALLEQGPIEPPKPEYGERQDGIGIFYRGMVNTLIGDPESGKTLLAQTTAADVLFLGGKVLIIDLDHNGPEATISRMSAFGISAKILTDPDRFRYTEPEDAAAIQGIRVDAEQWKPDFVLIDSFGELGPLYGANSNSGDDFTRVHSAAIKPFATLGACVVFIDHQAKGTDSRVFGATGTTAKKRAISGTSLRVTVEKPFTPGAGGVAEITLVKDRHGGLRARCPQDKEPLVGRFHLTDREGVLNWDISAPAMDERPRMSTKIDGATGDYLLEELKKLDPAPKSIRDIKDRCSWGTGKASEAWRLWNEMQGVAA